MAEFKPTAIKTIADHEFAIPSPPTILQTNPDELDPHDAAMQGLYRALCNKCTWQLCNKCKEEYYSGPTFKELKLAKDHGPSQNSKAEKRDGADLPLPPNKKYIANHTDPTLLTHHANPTSYFSNPITYMPSESYYGIKPGYLYREGEFGTGYYKEGYFKSCSTGKMYSNDEWHSENCPCIERCVHGKMCSKTCVHGKWCSRQKSAQEQNKIVYFFNRTTISSTVVEYTHF